ncbi:hypothetical protein [Priestia megaterium]
MSEKVLFANADECEKEVFETYWQSINKHGFMSEGQWDKACRAGEKYFKFTQDQHTMYTAISECYCGNVEKAVYETNNADEVFKVVQQFVGLFFYFIREDELINGVQA